LSGLRVVDLTRILAGPFCSMLLADMGAEVIKIETPGEGDPVRRQGVVRDGLSWYFAGFNRNKRSLTLNLRHPEGRAVLEKLIAGCDVLVENFRPGVLADMGFDAARLNALNPALVYCNITGFGSSGPYRDRPSFDFVAQAMSGFMSVTGEPHGVPMRAGPPIADLVAGLYGALGVCAALVRRGRSEHGETVGASLNNGMISMLGFLAANYLATGEQPLAPATTMRSSHPMVCFARRTARWRWHPRRSSPISGWSMPSACPSCATTRGFAPTICASRTGGRSTRRSRNASGAAPAITGSRS
jgi:crotonobetainyl-CoA:carnitine CoA-transferase CaiB-like acyl-CoA transferase